MHKTYGLVSDWSIFTIAKPVAQPSGGKYRGRIETPRIADEQNKKRKIATLRYSTGHLLVK